VVLLPLRWASAPIPQIRDAMFRSALIVLGLLLSSCTPDTGHSEYYSRETRTKSYQDVMAELEIAITERNFRITGHNKIGSVIRERDGGTFPDYDTFQFCNLTEARVMLEMSPETVAWMPCNIAIRQEKERVVVTTHLLPTDSHNPKLRQFALTMNQKLRDIVNFSIED
jgi:uncharacterized protein (DUF302 family)